MIKSLFLFAFICKNHVRHLFFLFLVLSLTSIHAISSPDDWSRMSDDMIISDFSKSDKMLVLSCNGSVQISLGQNGMALVTPRMLISDKLPSYSQFKAYVNHTGSNMVSCDDIGKVIMATVVDTTSGQSCWSTLIVEDKLMPSVNCMSDTLPCTEDPFSYDYNEFITITDNCDPNPTAYFDLRFEKLNCGARYVAIAHLTWTVTDRYNNRVNCSNDIYFKKAPLDSIVFPQDDTLYCPSPDFSSLEGPTIFGESIDPFCDLFASFTEDSSIVCGGMYKKTRRWTVRDWCTGASRSMSQLITIADTTAPSVVCPANFTIGTSASSCGINYTIPQGVATDACSPSASIQFFVRVDSTYLTRPGQSIFLEPGLHSFNFIAIDPCGNSDTCTYSGLIVDRSLPTLVCLPKLVVSLGLDGKAFLTADHVLALTYVYDNCGIDTAWIARMSSNCGRPQDTIFRDSVYFCCEDIGNNPMLFFQVRDAAGNVSTCMIEIEVQNKVPIQTSCPSNITISCTIDYRDLNKTGRFKPIAICVDTLSLTYRDSGMIDSCKIGTIYRKFFLTYRSGTVDSSCTQRITVVNNFSFVPSSIRWRNDTTLLACRSNLPDSIGRPSAPGDSCSTVRFTYRDGSIMTRADSCRFFDRFWTAYTPCNGGQYLRDTQRITLINYRAPRLIAPRDTIIGSEEDSCARYVNLPLAYYLGCNSNVQITNSYNSGGANASGIYQVGTTRVIYTATDECGNVGRDTTFIVVLDQINPRIQCRVLILDMPANDSIKLTARQLLSSYRDNCTPSHLLKISFTRGNFNDTCRYITCADLLSPPDTFSIDIYVQDEAGNVGICRALVIVNDPNNNCGTNAQGNIVVQGLIRMLNDDPITGVKVDLEGNGMSGVNDLKGKYLFNKINSGVKLKIKPRKDDEPLYGISTWDIIQIQKHILGIEFLKNPYALIAADVDNNKRVSAADISALRRMILGLEDHFQGNTSWRFCPSSHKFANPSEPLQEDLEEEFNTGYLFEGIKVDFLGIKIGDVSGANDNFSNALVARYKQLDAKMLDRNLNAGTWTQTEIVPVQTVNAKAIEMHFKYDQNIIELEQIEEVISDQKGNFLNTDEYSVRNGAIHISWLCKHEEGKISRNKAFLVLHWRVKATAKLSDVLGVDQSRVNELYGTDDQTYELKIKYDKELLNQDDPIINNLTTEPNPFSSTCKLRFESTLDGIAEIEFSNQAGQTIAKEEMKLSKGINFWQIDQKILPHAGVYYYRVTAGRQRLEGKLIKID